MGGIVTGGGVKIASALNEIAQQKKMKNSYRSLVNQADKQARELKLEQQEEQINLLRTAAEKNRMRLKQYYQQISDRKASLAAAGLDANSATVRQLLQQHSLENSLAVQENQQELEDSLEANRQHAAQRIRQLQEKVQSGRQLYRQSRNGWKLGAKFFSFLSR